MQQITVQEKAPLLAYLYKTLENQKRTAIKNFLEHKCVAVNGKVTTQFNHLLDVGDKITIQTRKESASLFQSQIKIVHEDDHIIVIDKPAGLLTVGTDKIRQNTAFYKLFDYVDKTAKHEQTRLFIVHRLDQDTSGLIVLAKNFAAKKNLQRNWNKTEKKYDALVHGTPKEKTGEIRSYLKENKFLSVYSTKKEVDAKPAVTRYRVVKTSPRYSLLEIETLTGKKHQIRVHLADLGNPIVGDDRYSRDYKLFKRLCLHASQLTIQHPVTKKKMTFRSELPHYFSLLLGTP